MSDDCTHVNLVVPANLRVPGHKCIRPYLRAGANLHVFLNNCVRPDSDGRIKFRLWADNGCWMNQHDAGKYKATCYALEVSLTGCAQ